MIKTQPKAIIAFSGGLDTSFCIPYMKQKGYEVITVTVNTGGMTSKQLKAVKKTAVSFGAFKHYEIDASASLYKRFVSYIIKANYLKNGAYPACVGPERNVIAEEVVKVAKKEKASVIVHGSTAAGNDQVRFDLALRALCPEAEIVAPIRDYSLTREQEIEFLQKNNLHTSTGKKDYSINIGLLGTTISGKETKTTYKELPDSVFPTVADIDDTPKKPEQISLKFKQGLPTHLNGHALSGVKIIEQLNKIAARHGYGKGYHIGSTIIGIKGRIAFEAPAVKLLIQAHTELEKIVLTSKQLFWKNTLGNVYGDLIHDGLYYEPLLRNLEAFLDSASLPVEGEVKIKLYKGNMNIVSLSSPYSLFNFKLGTYGELANKWTGEEAKGFCSIYGTESVNSYLIQKNIWQKKIS